MKKKFFNFIDKHAKAIDYLYCVNIAAVAASLGFYHGFIYFTGVQYDWIFSIFKVLVIPYFILTILYFILFIRIGTGDLKD